MSVDVSGGSLKWTAELDTSQFDQSLSGLNSSLDNTFKSATVDAKAFSTELQNTAKATGVALDPKIVTTYADQVAKASTQLNSIIAKSVDSLDPQRLEELRKQVAGSTDEFKQLSAIIDFIKNNIGGLKLNDTDSKALAESIKTIETSFGDFTETQVRANTRLRQLKDAMVALGDKGGPVFEELQNEAAKLQKEVDETNKSVRLLGSTTGGLQAGVQVVRGVVGGFEAIAGAVGLASGKSEEMEHIISSIIASLGVLNGIQEVAEVIDKRSALNQFLIAQYRKLTATNTLAQAAAVETLAGAQVTETTAVEGATVAQTELNTAMAANPAFILVAAIGALAAAVFFLTKRNDDATESSVRLNKTLLDQYNVSNAIFELSKHTANDQVAAQQANLEAAKAQNLSIQEVFKRQTELGKLKERQAAEDLKKAKDDLTGANSLSKSLDDIFAKQAKIAGTPFKPSELGFQNTTDLDALIKKLDLMQNKLVNLKNSAKADDKKNQIDVLSTSIDLLKAKIEAVIKGESDLKKIQTDNQNDALAQQQKVYAEGVKSFTSAAEAKTLALGKSSQEQLSVLLNQIKAEEKAALDVKINPNLTAGEEEKIKAESLKRQAEAVFAANQKELSDTEKLLSSKALLFAKGSEERLQLELQSLRVSKEAQLQEFVDLNGKAVQFRKLTNEQIQIINDNFVAQTREKNKEFFQQIIDDQLSAQISVDNARLANVRDSSSQELEIKKQLIDDQAALDIQNAKIQITNEQLLQARILEIQAVAIRDRQKLEDDFVQHQLQNRFKLIDAQAEKSKVTNNDVLSDPVSTAKDKLNAQLANLDIDAEDIRKKMQATESAILEVIRTGNGDIEKLIEQRRSLSKQLASVNKQINNTTVTAKDQTLAADVKILNQVGSAINTLGNNLKQYDSNLGDIIISIGTIAKDSALILNLMKSTATTEQKIGAGLEAAVQLISLVVSAAAQRAAAEKQFNASLIEQQEQYNLALNENILLNTKLKDNVFVQDFQGQLKDSIAAIKDAQSQYQKVLGDLAKGQVKVGNKNVVSGSAVLNGAASGATLGLAIGTIIPGIGNVVGAVVGGIIGGIVGLFGGKKSVDKYVNLLQAYPELLKKGASGQAEINKELAQSLIASGLLDANTKVLVQNALDWQDAMDKAHKQLTDIISELAGSLGNDLRDSLVTAFEDGTDAGIAFANSVQKTMENVLSQLLFNNIFGSAFDDLQKQFEDSFQAGGDFNWQDDLQNFFAQYAGLSTEFDNALKDAQDEAKKAGLTIFGSTTPAEQKQNGLSGAIKGITEQTAELIAGQFGGLRITALDQLKVAQNSYTALNDIRANTAMILDVKNSLRDFQLNGIKVK